MGTVTPIVKMLILKISLLFPLCVKLYPLKFCAYQKNIQYPKLLNTVYTYW